MQSFFVTWYYTAGVKAAFQTLLNFIRVILQRFNIAGLAATLLAPWRKDVAPRDWLGFHPLRSLGRFFENSLTRFLGMWVRLGTIGVGLVLVLLVILGGLVFVFGALLAPLFLIIGGVGMFQGLVWGAPIFWLGIVGLGLMTFGYLNREVAVLPDHSFTSVRQSALFPRILARLSLSRDNLPESALLSEESFLQHLQSVGLNRPDFERAILIEEHRAAKRRAAGRFWSWENLSKVTRTGKYWKYGYTTLLDRFALDLSRFDPTSYAHEDLVGRTDALKNALVILERPSENSMVLIGEAGTGKQTFIHYLARLIRENVFAGTRLDEMRVLVLDLGEAVSLAANQGQDPEALVRQLLNQAAFAGNILLVIEHLDRYLLPDSQGHNFAAVFAEYLALPPVRIIGTMSPQAYHVLSQGDQAVLKHMEAVTLKETEPDETLSILLAEFEALENKRVWFSLPAFEHIIKNAERIHWETPFPERAIDLAEEVLTYHQGNASEAVITPAVVDAYLEQKSGVPRGEIKAEEREQLLHLEDKLHGRVIGQENAVKQVAEALRKARAGFGNDKRPIGSFLFLGPTGVGKTETAKALAETYFGGEEHMIRLDMSEFQTSDAADRLIRSSGKGIQGKLSEAAQTQPYGLLLLDELEKTYPSALDLFLQILDEGFVTDGYGQKVNFRNMIIIATSNAEAVTLRKLIESGADQKSIEEQMLNALIEGGTFRPEFLNRFDGVIFFNPLQSQELVQVVNIKLAALKKRLAEEKNIHVDFAPGLAEGIVAQGYEPEFGARSLNRYLEDVLEDKLAKAIIAGELKSGGTLLLSTDMLSL